LCQVSIKSQGLLCLEPSVCICVGGGGGGGGSNLQLPLGKKL